VTYLKSKKGFTTKNFVIAGILFSGLIALFVLSIAGISNEYGSTALTNENFANTYNKLTQQTEKIGTAREAAAAGSGLSFVGTFDVAFKSTFTVFQMVYQTLDLFGGMGSSFAGDFGLNPLVVGIVFVIALAILTTLIVWQLVGAISRGKI